MTFAPPSAGGRPRPTVAASAGRRPRAPPSEWRARGGWRAATTASPVAATGAAGGKASRTLSTAAVAVDASSAVAAARGFGPSPAPPVAAHLSAGACDGWGVTPSPSGSLPPGRCERPPRQSLPTRADVGAAPTVCGHCRCSAAFRRSRPRGHRAQPHPTSTCTTTPLSMGGGPPSHAAQEGISDSFRLPTEISPQAGEETNGGSRGGAERCPSQREAAPYGVGGYADSMPPPLRGLLFAICSYGGVTVPLVKNSRRVHCHYCFGSAAQGGPLGIRAAAGGDSILRARLAPLRQCAPATRICSAACSTHP